MTQNSNRPTSTKKLVIIGIFLGLAVAVVAFMSGADADTGKQFAGLAQLAIAVAVLGGGAWAAARRRRDWLTGQVGFTLARLGAATMLIVGLGRNAYDFYTIMRWVVCGVSAYGAYLEFERKRQAWAWVFAIMSIAFNPIAPVHLSRETWAPIDCIAAGILVVSVFTGRKPTAASER
jgi:hypothetical protein